MTQVRLHLAMVLTVLITGCSSIGPIAPDSSADTRIQIASEPSGASLYLMGIESGTTPVTISERDIYPVSYTPGTEKYYGMIILRKEGCKDFSKRLTRSDVYKGLVARLDCETDVANEAVQPALTPAKMPAQKPYPEDAASSPDLPAQQLEQLRTLQRLQEEGVLTDDEEKKLRKRILNKP